MLSMIIVYLMVAGGLQSKMMFPFLHLPKYIHAHTRQILIFFEYITNPIIIKNNVWIAANAMILDGSILNEFSVIGANSCFTLLEYFGLSYDPIKILEREQYWKKCLDTIRNGYNDN